MKKNLILFISLFLSVLFAVSCSGPDEDLSCLVAADCPDSSFSCINEVCVLNDAANEITDSDKQDENGSSTGGNGSNSGSGDDNSDINGSENGNDDESGLPDPVTNDGEGNSGSSDDDASETSDADGVEENDGETNDDNGNESDNDNENNDENGIASDDGNENGDGDIEEGNPVGQLTDCTKNEDCLSNFNNIRCDTALGKCVMCISNDDCLTAYGQTCDLTTHECVSNATCAAAIEKLPHGGKFDWEDGTTQGFSTNAYWDLVNDPTISNGAYSFGQYSGYTDNMDYTSVLQPVDLSICSGCAVNVLYYAKGAIPKSENGYDFIHPTCNGDGTTTAKNSTVSIQSLTPQSPWVMADAYYQKVNSYSTTAWTTSEWQIPASCKTDKFVFGLRFSSNGSISYATSHSYLGLVVDDLTIAPAATGHEPDGEFESASNGYIKGWACDLDAPLKYILIKIEYYKNKDESAVAAVRWVYAKLQRPGDAELETKCSSTYNHGFEMPLDEGLKTLLGEDGTHKAVVYAVDIPATENLCGGTYTKLGEREFEVTGAEPK
ncbi:hypothetical protein J6Z19_08965 [bacterium]|nr:hypothetical protein [bacterium]